MVYFLQKSLKIRSYKIVYFENIKKIYCFNVLFSEKDVNVSVVHNLITKRFCVHQVLGLVI